MVKVKAERWNSKNLVMRPQNCRNQFSRGEAQRAKGINNLKGFESWLEQQ